MANQAAAAAAEAAKHASAPERKGGGATGRARSGARATEMNQLNVAMVGALNATGGATNSVLNRGDTPTGLLDGAAASGAGRRLWGCSPGSNL